MNILIYGTGLIGGSFALALKEQDPNLRFGGWDEDEASLEEAHQLGIVDEVFESVEEALMWAKGIVLAIPVSAILAEINNLLDHLRSDQFIVDFGSTKGSICSAVSSHPRRNHFIAAHPIAGTEYSGPKAAFAGLYHNKVMIVCEHERSNISFVKTFVRWCESLNMRLVFMGSEEHDKHLAYISHLSHVIAYGLSQTVLDKEKNGEVILELAGSGFASTVRLAKSSPDMWTPIMLDNKVPLLESLDSLINQLNEIRSMISEENSEALHLYLSEGRKIRKILD